MNNKLRIGVWIEDNNPEIGGGFGYYHQILGFLLNINDQRFEFKYISDSKSNSVVQNPKFYRINLDVSRGQLTSFLVRAVNKISRILLKKNLFITEVENRHLVKKALSEVIDIIYYLTPNIPVDYFPFIVTVWDLGHLNSYPFPEVSADGEYEKRDRHYRDKVRKALLIVCESKIGKDDFLKYYPIFSDRIEILPLVPSKIIYEKVIESKPLVLSNKNIEFIHYPAQFWPHKNHYNLILAFADIVKVRPELKLILTGSDKGNLDHISSLITNLGLHDSIHYLGFVKENELKWLYKNSLGLVMPTFLGPTNMPLLEAAILNCKVACSNLTGHYEQLGDYANYFSPFDIESIKLAIFQMLGNEKKVFNFDLFTTEQKLLEIFSKANHIRSCWA
jgi:glycosyltransferase involved in cell wall biosynthesis